jgi:hypothetical protein
LSREHYAWGSLRRTGRQLGVAAVVSSVGFVVIVVIVVSLLIFGAGE